MSVLGQMLDMLRAVVARRGYDIVSNSVLFDWQKQQRDEPSYNCKTSFPSGAPEYLQSGNPRLVELQQRYAAFDKQVTAPLVWTPGHLRDEEILYFRGDNAYVWQLRGPNMNPMSYALTAYFVKSIDSFGLLDQIEEDGSFGCHVFNIDKKIVSRDLLNSIIEIYFLDAHFGLMSSNCKTSILDIGAGYGRLAHRVSSACPGLGRYWCTDGVAVSTFISEYYLRCRETSGKASVIPLDKIEVTLKQEMIDLAINIHSFSECAAPAIAWWLSRLAKAGVKRLMIAPNSMDHGGEKLFTNDGTDMGEIILAHGYKLIAREPKYRDPMIQKYGINPTYYYLFELR